MPLYDFHCEACGHEAELLFPISACPESMPCEECQGGTLRKVISLGRASVLREEAPWLRDVLTVVDKDSNAPHVRQFLQDPTRGNYKAWLQGEGLRPVESGERQGRPTVDRARLREAGKRRFFEQCRSGRI
ncbi:FmdB family zinc ribbon protein [Desulfocurvibacter africanus]|uniref:Regulatory protein, FmdB family n=1 Tax=Desulfocurvibacter africanus subsp. africanus str. Walvis Bay TaxID=690850 RepID=F3YXJ9_DESAF|nr:zinc ribbon domain-containing protein [Desulfocurvibacter africanus]EGJ51776.1 regulatory protein, FmdB family [Desulfocurvibacter africanus subsp. africanus str. Walvis Bay]